MYKDMEYTIDKKTGHEIAWDGRTVWVNSCKDGSAIGRFSARGGVDVHQTLQNQVDTGTECLDCCPLGGEEGWHRFCASMLKYHDVVIPEEARPRFISA